MEIIKSIGFVGLSHLGLNHLIAAAEKGFKVVGYQDDTLFINNIKKNKLNIEEPGFKKLFKKNKKKILFTSDIKDLKKCDLVFVSLDVPTDSKNRSSLKKINYFVKKTTKILKKNSALIVLSQVPPGYTKKINWRKENLYYQVETLIFGQAIKRSLQPERIIVGLNDKRFPINKKYRFYLSKFKCPIFYMDYLSAELCKTSINLFLTSSISTTNILAEICEKTGASWSSIYPAIQADRRIGKYSYLKPGLGISGGNLERDINTLINIANKEKVNQNILKYFIKNSAERKKWIYSTLKKHYLSKKVSSGKIGILGLSYKENTNSTKNSSALYLINKLKKYFISVYDPKVSKIYLGKNIFREKSVNQVLKKSEILIICTPWSEFRKIKINQLIRSIKKKIIIDPFQILDRDKLIQNGFLYKSLGEL